MAADPSKRRRVEVPTDLYLELERDAKRLHMPVQTLINSMLARTLETDRARALIPMRDRVPAAAAAKPSRKGYSAAYAAGLVVKQDIEQQLAGELERSRVK